MLEKTHLHPRPGDVKTDLTKSHLLAKKAPSPVPVFEGPSVTLSVHLAGTLGRVGQVESESPLITC